MDSAVARDYWKDLVREQVDGEQAQAMPMTLELLERMVAALEAEPLATRRVAPRLRALAEDAQQRRRRRDIALLHVAYDLLMRAAELVAMPWERIEPLAQGGGTYRFGRTKTDQAGRGRTLYLRRWGSERMPIRYAERVLAEHAGEDRFARVEAMRRNRRVDDAS